VPTTAEESISSIRVYTLEEIDDNLATLSNILRYSKHADKKSVTRQIDNWLDRRLGITGGT